jgi:Flp pilus assembly protein TadD
VQTDDRLALEFSAPRAIYGRFQENNVDRLRELARDSQQPTAVAAALARATGAEWAGRGMMLVRAGAPRLAYLDFERAAAAAPGQAEALRGLVRSAAQVGRLTDAERVLTRAANGGSVPALVELSIVHAARGDVDAAIDTARRAVVANPRDRAALRQLAAAYAEAGQEEGLERLIQLADQAGEPAAALYGRLRLAYLRGGFGEAADAGEELARLDPGDADVWTLIGSSRAALGQYDRAREALESAQRLAPADARVLVNLGTVALRAADLSTARARFSEAVFLDPTLPAARQGLADVLERQGQSGRAAALRERIPAP